MKKIITILLTLSMLFTLSVAASAAGDVSRMNDGADIFTAEEEAALLEKQDSLSEEYSVDMVVLTTRTLDGKIIADYAEGYFAEHGFGMGNRGDGMMITMDMESNSFYTSAAGRCAQLLDEEGYAFLDDAVLDALALEEATYADGIDAYLDACEVLLSEMELTTVEQLPLVIDNADLLSEGEEAELSEKLTEISDRLACDVIVLTEAEIEDEAMAHADDYFDYNGYGRGGLRDGILLLVSMSPRKWHISGSGICNSEYITSAAIEEYLGENMVEDLQAEDYVGCFNTYAERCDDLISAAREGRAYKAPFNAGMSVVVSLAIGFIVAFIVTGSMKGKLKSVKMQNQAASYLKSGSLMVTDAREMFLYSQITRTKKQSESSNSGSHTSSSGRSHSGAGGSF